MLFFSLSIPLTPKFLLKGVNDYKAALKSTNFMDPRKQMPINRRYPASF